MGIYGDEEIWGCEELRRWGDKESSGDGEKSWGEGRATEMGRGYVAS